LQQWNLKLAAVTQVADENTHLFAVWAKAFCQLCQQQHWLEPARLPTELTLLLTSKLFFLPQRIFLAGFDLLTPQQQQLLNALQPYVQIEPLPSVPQLTPHVSRLGLLDTEQEIYSMATWAYQTWQSNPALQIGCIVPELNPLRNSVKRIFTEIFAPHTLLPGQPKIDLPYNISAGKWLIDYPLVHDALQALRLNFQEVDITALSELLRSPFLGGGFQEAEARAVLDLELRRTLLQPRLTLRDTFALAQQNSTAHYCPLWVAQAREFLQVNKQVPKKQLPSQWAENFQQQLRCLGWPGDRVLDSEEYQVEQRWQRILSEFTRLDELVGQVNMQTALQHLQQLASEELFQPETPVTTVQILGHFEATGLTFDRLWVMGISDRSWPPVLAPNPLLPMALQRRFNMPKANMEQELQFYQRLTQRFTESASQVIYSYAQQTDGCTLQPSPLIIDYPAINSETLDLQLKFPAHAIFAQRAIESWYDDTAPTVTPFEKIKGGAEILKNQAACPFRAFANSRLHAHAIPTPQYGLDHQQRGQLVHASLMNVWQKLQNHAQLQSLTENELNEIVNNAVSAALQQLTKKHPYTLAAHYYKLESQRLQQLLQEWLNLEKQRAPFQVLAHEQAQEVLLAGLAMRLRLDRIDELADGSQVIIDYKTGQDISVNDWFDQRPKEPQLPLYVIINSDKVRGLLFAQVRAGKMQFKGITESTQQIVNKHVETRQDWPILVENWRNTLQQLARDFYNGKAQVDPKEQQQTCQHCNLQILCRVRN
jgi:ATP-dependent helicase/nuclease subunit B